MKFKKYVLLALGIVTVFAGSCMARPSKKEFFDTCANGTAYEVRNAIQRGAYVNATDSDGQNALMFAAAMNRDPEVIKALLRAGADVDADDNDGTTALMFAAGSNRNPEVVRALLRAGADIDETDDDGLTALTYAVTANGNPAVAEALIRAGASVRRASKEANLLQLLRENKKLSSRDRDWLWDMIDDRL